MEITLRFPSSFEVVQNEARAFQQLPPRERVLSIVDLITAGVSLLESSPHRARIEEQQRRCEEDWQRAHRDLFRKHGL